jgi:hypothetical protein
MINQSKVRVIGLFPEAIGEAPDNTPIEEVKASLKTLQEAKAGQRILLSQMWEGIDVD